MGAPSFLHACPARGVVICHYFFHVRELAVARGVLQFASKASLRDANALLDAYKVMTYVLFDFRGGRYLPACCGGNSRPACLQYILSVGRGLGVGRVGRCFDEDENVSSNPTGLPLIMPSKSRSETNAYKRLGVFFFSRGTTRRCWSCESLR